MTYPALPWDPAMGAADSVSPERPARAIPRPLTPEATYARAALRMRRGKRLVVAGFVVAVLGMVVYGIASLAPGAAGGDHGAGVGLGLGVIGLGTLLWLVGSLGYVSAAMDADPEGPSASF